MTTQLQDAPPVALTLSAENSSLCRKLARTLFGDPDALSNVITEALHLLAFHKSDEARCEFLLQQLEAVLLKRIDSQLTELENGLSERTEKLFERQAGLLLGPSYDASLSQLMLRELYKRDNAAIPYDELNRAAAAKLERQFSKTPAADALALAETAKRLQAQLDATENQRIALIGEVERLHAEAAAATEQQRKLAHGNQQLAKAVKAYETLAQWQDRRVAEAPKIQAKNSSLLRAQSWSAALAEFEANEPRPAAPKLITT